MAVDSAGPVVDSGGRPLDKTTPIYVAGHRGMVGAAVCRRLAAGGYRNVVVASREELDLREQGAVRAFFERERPRGVVLAAARVGGIAANAAHPAAFIGDNLAIQTHVIDAAHRVGVERFLFLGSSCAYPRDAPQPLVEDALLSGPLEPTNQWYAVAKIAGVKMVQAYRQQYGFPGISLMPTNLYGPGDNFDLETGHVLPALLRKIHLAKERGEGEVSVWGSGNPRREFLHVDDLADAVVFLLEREGREVEHELLNIGVGHDLSIRELATLLCEVVGFDQQLVFDASRPEGTPRKLLDVSRITELGWRPTIALRDGVAATYQWFLAHKRELRGGDR